MDPFFECRSSRSSKARPTVSRDVRATARWTMLDDRLNSTNASRSKRISQFQSRVTGVANDAFADSSAAKSETEKLPLASGCDPRR